MSFWTKLKKSISDGLHEVWIHFAPTLESVGTAALQYFTQNGTHIVFDAITALKAGTPEDAVIKAALDASKALAKQGALDLSESVLHALAANAVSDAKAKIEAEKDQ